MPAPKIIDIMLSYFLVFMDSEPHIIAAIGNVKNRTLKSTTFTGSEIMLIPLSTDLYGPKFKK